MDAKEAREVARGKTSEFDAEACAAQAKIDGEAAFERTLATVKERAQAKARAAFFKFTRALPEGKTYLEPFCAALKAKLAALSYSVKYDIRVNDRYASAEMAVRW